MNIFALFIFSNVTFPIIIKAIKDAFGDDFIKYCNDIRFNFLNVKYHFIEAITCITNTPFDELIIQHTTSLESKVKPYREACTHKLKSTKMEETPASNEVNDQMQRKMNPSNDLTPPHNLIVYPAKENSAEVI